MNIFDNKPSEDELFARMLLVFTDQYESCNPEDADNSLSTKELYNKFQEFYPGDYDETAMALELSEHFDPHFDELTSKFIWCLKAKGRPPRSSSPASDLSDDHQ